MSSTLEFRWELQDTKGGHTDCIPARRLWTPQKRVTIAGTMDYRRTFAIPKRTPTSPQPDPVKLWSWNEAEGFFEILVLEIVGQGTLDLEWKSGAMISAEDPAPAGTHLRSSGCAMTCPWPFVLGLSEVLVNATLATAAGFDGDGYSAMLTSDGSGRGRIYELQATNPSTTDDVLVNVWAKA